MIEKVIAERDALRDELEELRANIRQAQAHAAHYWHAQIEIAVAAALDAHATPPAVQAQPVALTQALICEMTDDTREVFDASGSETPQVVRDVIEYVASWLQVYAEKRAAAQGDNQ